MVAISLLPILVITGYFEMRLQDHLQDDLREAYGKSAAIACEQIAAIRTVASLRRESALHAEFVASMDAPVRKAMISTAKSTFVYPFVSTFLTVVLLFQSRHPSIYQCTGFHFSLSNYRHCCSGMGALSFVPENILSFDFSFV